jgi:uncharacterized protein
MRPVEAGVKLLCDEMLGRMARYLRAAGYDTGLLVPGTDDGAAIARAAREGRLLLTTDRELAQRREARGRTLVLQVAPLDETARALSAALGIDWQHAPFTRCLVDNTPLACASRDQRAALPPRARGLAGPVRVCPACGRLYWPGSHVRRMKARLARWQKEARCG